MSTFQEIGTSEGNCWDGRCVGLHLESRYYSIYAVQYCWYINSGAIFLCFLVLFCFVLFQMSSLVLFPQRSPMSSLVLVPQPCHCQWEILSWWYWDCNRFNTDTMLSLVCGTKQLSYIDQISQRQSNSRWILEFCQLWDSKPLDPPLVPIGSPGVSVDLGSHLDPFSNELFHLLRNCCPRIIYPLCCLPLRNTV